MSVPHAKRVCQIIKVGPRFKSIYRRNIKALIVCSLRIMHVAEAGGGEGIQGDPRSRLAGGACSPRAPPHRGLLDPLLPTAPAAHRELQVHRLGL